MSKPIATYRLQVHAQFPFSNVEEIIGYLQALGISDIYLSPITEAQPGSTHGYDVINSNRINPELGGKDEFDRLFNELNKKSLGLVVDIVPNHMAATTYNIFWQDVVAKHQASEFAYYFDINWELSKENKLFYRRFFDINELVCLRMEDIAVFQATHQLLFQLIDNNSISGLRVDHIDGLLDPTGYLNRLRQRIGNNKYLVVEKILASREMLPDNWPIDGTTGYDFLNQANQVFISHKGFGILASLYAKLVNNDRSVAEIRYQSNKFVIKSLFKKEFVYLVNALQFLALACDKDFKLTDIRNALATVSALMPVYRTYIYNGYKSPQDSDIIAQTLEAAKNRESGLKLEILLFLMEIFDFNYPKEISDVIKQKWQDWIYRWQLLTGPMIAKGYEDTTCYRYNALISVNEVGSDAQLFEHLGNLDAFHHYNQYKLSHFPYSMNATSTHDTKRSEDVRARINVLSELSIEWSKLVKRWCKVHSKFKPKLAGYFAPSVNEEILIYQSLLGAWPLVEEEVAEFKQRFKQYIFKVLKEAKINSTWRKPNQLYEKTVQDFCDQLWSNASENNFLPEFLPFQKKVAFYGMINSLSQLVLKITSPGVADFYQGMEVWQFHLVDPDNRRPVDFICRQKLLNQLLKEQDQSDYLPRLLNEWRNGQIKLYITHKLLQHRLANRDIYTVGDYIPLIAEGKYANNIVAFLRNYQSDWLLVVVPRLLTEVVGSDEPPLGEVWQETQIVLPEQASRQWKNCLTQERLIISMPYRLRLADIFQTLPVAVLMANE